ncbi:MAG: serine hydrolase domain-containing protein, partial [Sphingomonadales bacterium]
MKFLYLIFILFFSTTIKAEGINQDAKVFDAFFIDLMEKHHIPGGAYAIIKNGKVVSMKGFGVTSLKNSKRINENTVFRLASVSKTFSSLLAAKLVEEKIISWTDQVSAFIPEFSLKRKDYTKGLQIQHILGQSAGIMPNAYDNYLEENFTLKQIMPKFKMVSSFCPPGNCYSYQNILYSLIQPVMEKSTTSTYEKLMNDKIFIPLNMTNSSLGFNSFINNKNHASPHVKTSNGWLEVEVKPNYYNVLPAAGVNASISDMSKWLMAQMGNNPETITKKMLETVTEKRVKTKRDLKRRGWRNYITDAHYGLGWRVYNFKDEELYYHGGWVSGFRADIAYSKTRKIGLVILLNAETNIISELSTSFWAN